MSRAMRWVARALIAASLASSAPAATGGPRITVDAELPDAATDRAALIDEARACVAEAARVLSRPGTREHFRRTYRLGAERLLLAADRAVVVRAFPPRPGAHARSVQVGGYVFGESSLAVNVEVLRAARRSPQRDAWRAYIGGVLVHELAHLADWLDDGENNDGGLEVEEGEEAQRIAGCALEPPEKLPYEEPSLAARANREGVWPWAARRTAVPVR